MCLYPKFIRNKRYTPNKKNGGYYQLPNDERKLYVPVGCGNCIECRKQKAREWQVRLNEELKIHKYKYFVTLTFSNENLIKLCKEKKITESNAIAGIAVRRFMERWRKIYGKSLKHWLITELGHENTERIHLHGILFADTEITKDTLEKIWKYGRADNGKYCNEKSIGYIVKYVTKIDIKHKTFKAQIFCSAGIGKNYINEFNLDAHKYRPKNTKEYYTLNNGCKVALPIYYRNKLFTEDERDNLWTEKLDKQITYVRGIKVPLKTSKDFERYFELLKQQQEDNIRLGYGDDSKDWKKEDYNITLRMLNAKSK